MALRLSVGPLLMLHVSSPSLGAHIHCAVQDDRQCFVTKSHHHFVLLSLHLKELKSSLSFLETGKNWMPAY